MTIIQHGVWGFLMVSMKNRTWAIIGAILGALPDLIGYSEKVFYGDYTRWGWYLWAHKEAWYLWFIPPIGFHVLIDYLTHDDKGWNAWAWGVECAGWLIIITIILGFYLRRKA